MNEPKLKPCCGYFAYAVKGILSGRWIICCRRCGDIVDARWKWLAIRRWNTRKEKRNESRRYE